MKRENLYLVGGALLASTALSTAADAATITLREAPLPANLTGTAVSRPLSVQTFAATPSTATVLGPASVVIRFNQPIASKFTSVLTLTNAKFVTSSVDRAQPIAGFGTSGTVSSIAATYVCSTTTATDKIIFDCDTSVAIASIPAASVLGIFVSNVTFNNATALATAGGTANMEATITVASVVFETAASAAVITGTNSLTTSATAATGLANINVNSTPTAFTNLVGGATSVVIGTITITLAGAVGTDLFSALTKSGTVGATSFVRITSPILADDAINEIRLSSTSVGANTLSRNTAFGTGVVTFTFGSPNSLLESFAVNVDFTGKAQIDTAAAGSVDITYAAFGTGSSSSNAIAPASLTGGTVAGLSRGGLNVDINHIQPGTAQGAKTYTSLLRINNTASFAGTVTVVLRNDATGTVLGTYTSPSIPAGASIQVSSAQLETAAGITPNASVLYRASVSGAINGYVQHVNWNQDAGFFSDLSANRN